MTILNLDFVLELTPTCTAAGFNTVYHSASRLSLLPSVGR